MNAIIMASHEIETLPTKWLQVGSKEYGVLIPILVHPSGDWFYSAYYMSRIMETNIRDYMTTETNWKYFLPEDDTAPHMCIHESSWVDVFDQLCDEKLPNALIIRLAINSMLDALEDIKQTLEDELDG